MGIYETQKDKTHTAVSSHRQLIVWQKSMTLVSLVYRASGHFPQEEKFGLTSQMRRAAVSIPSNIAEGRARNSRKDFVQFLHIALGSLAELETQLDISESLSYLKKADYTEVVEIATEVRKMLIAMILSLKALSSKL